MNKKLFLTSIMVLLIMLLPESKVFAGDIPESALTYATNALLGTVEETEDAKVTLKVSEVLFGDFKGDTIEIVDFKYLEGAGNFTKPEVGDECAVVVDADNKIYEYLCAKADSLDRKTLNLKSSAPFIVRMNNYINNGWYSNANRDRIKKAISGGEMVGQEKAEESTYGIKLSEPETAQIETHSQDNLEVGPATASPSHNTVVFPVIISVLFIIGAAVFIKGRRNKRN